MQLEYLKEFRELCVNYQLNFSNAADALHMTQPALSNHVSQIENEMDVQLIDRGKGRSSNLTPAGITFLNRLDELLNLLTDIQNDCQNAAISAENVVRVRLPLFSPPFLTHKAHEFERANHGDVHVEFIEGTDSIDPLIALEENQIDCCLLSFVDGAEIPDNPKLSYVEIPESREEVLVWIDKSHPLASGKSIRREDIQMLIMPVFTLAISTTSGDWIDDICQQIGCQPKRISRYANSTNASFLNEYTEKDATFLPAHYREQPVVSLMHSRTFRSLESPLFTTIYAVFRKNEINKTVLEFKEFLQQTA